MAGERTVFSPPRSLSHTDIKVNKVWNCDHGQKSEYYFLNDPRKWCTKLSQNNHTTRCVGSCAEFTASVLKWVCTRVCITWVCMRAPKGLLEVNPAGEHACQRSSAGWRWRSIASYHRTADRGVSNLSPTFLNRYAENLRNRLD
jgi:hypothetical protein